MYVVLCAGFLASQFYRVSNAVIAPELMRGLGISAEAMGLMTGVYFLAFAAAQLPVGMLLDRFGPRRTMAGVVLLAIVGSVTFATASGFTGLVIGRGLMGVGCAAALMGALVTISRWFSEARFAFLSSLLYTLGGAGLLLATTPLAVVSTAFGWRGAFWLMGAVTTVLAALLYAVVRDAPGGRSARPGERESVADMWHGLRAVMGNRQLRYVCAIQFVNYGTVLAVAGLWAGPYLNDVHGLDGVSRGNVLLVLNVAMLAGVMGFSAVERWLGSRKWSIGSGGIASTILLLVLASVPSPGLWPAVVLLVLFGLVSAYVMLLHAHARAVLPPDLVGRGLTLQNVAVFLGVFVMQALSGFIVGAFGSSGGTAPETAYRAVFGVLALVTGAGLLIYLRCEEPLRR
jgi:predicted MFS family arabinose efflux permease